MVVEGTLPDDEFALELVAGLVVDDFLEVRHDGDDVLGGGVFVGGDEVGVAVTDFCFADGVIFEVGLVDELARADAFFVILVEWIFEDAAGGFGGEGL